VLAVALEAFWLHARAFPAFRRNAIIVAISLSCLGCLAATLTSSVGTPFTLTYPKLYLWTRHVDVVAAILVSLTAAGFQRFRDRVPAVVQRHTLILQVYLCGHAAIAFLGYWAGVGRWDAVVDFATVLLSAGCYVTWLGCLRHHR
jgi:hypothetical protein